MRSPCVTRRRVKTTDSTPSDSFGPCHPTSTRTTQKSLRPADEFAATSALLPYDTCSPACSASSTTANTLTKPTTRSRHSVNQQRSPTNLQLDFLARSEVYRDANPVSQQQTPPQARTDKPTPNIPHFLGMRVWATSRRIWWPSW